MSSVQTSAVTHVADPERERVDRLRELDQDVWAALFDEHQPKIWRYVFARTSDRQTADDVTSQLFVEALESIHRFRYRGKPILAWLFRIARNQMGKLFRSRKREVPGPAPDPVAEDTEATLDSIVLAEALSTLTRDQTDAVILRFFSGYSTREIAQFMGKSESAVYSLQIRAIASMRRYLRKTEKVSSQADETRPSTGIAR